MPTARSVPRHFVAFSDPVRHSIRFLPRPFPPAFVPTAQPQDPHTRVGKEQPRRRSNPRPQIYNLLRFSVYGYELITFWGTPLGLCDITRRYFPVVYLAAHPRVYLPTIPTKRSLLRCFPPIDRGGRPGQSSGFVSVRPEWPSPTRGTVFRRWWRPEVARGGEIVPKAARSCLQAQILIGLVREHGW